MDTIYVVMECEYDYESSSEVPILATFDKAKADAKCMEMCAVQDVRKANQAALTDHMKQWEASNPRPVYKEPRLKGLPDYGPKRNKWSAEQLAEYKAAKQHNEDKRSAAIKPSQDWGHAYKKESDEYIKTFSNSEQFYQSHDLVWEVQEVPYVD